MVNAAQIQIDELAEIESLVKILTFGEKEAHFSALIRAQLEKRAMPIGPYDVLIAGMTMAHQGTLVTNNAKEFNRVSELKLDVVLKKSAARKMAQEKWPEIQFHATREHGVEG